MYSSLILVALEINFQFGRLAAYYFLNSTAILAHFSSLNLDLLVNLAKDVNLILSISNIHLFRYL